MQKKMVIYKNTRFYIILHDCIAIAFAWFGAFWLHFNIDKFSSLTATHALNAFPTIFIIQLLAYWAFGLYRGIWRFASIPDLIRIIKSVTLATVCMIVISFLSKMTLTQLPAAIYILYALLLVTILGGSRFFYRWSKNQLQVQNQKQKRVLIVGAGQAGEGLVRDLLRDASATYQAIIFVDDNVKKIGHDIHGIRIAGQSSEIPQLVKKYDIEKIIIAIPSATSSTMRRLVNLCESINIPVLTLPSLRDLANGKVTLDTLREVAVEDLLGREPVNLNWDTMKNSIENKTIFVTGGGGSIGSELCLQVAKLNPRNLIILDHSEYNLYQIEKTLEEKFPHVNCIYILGSITNKNIIKFYFEKYKPHIVFHAAAYKHVPILENQIQSAIKNNLLGTYSLAEEACAFGIEKFILISTDKAVNPANIMGATKRAAEIICQNMNIINQTKFITVRFGNVLNSTGSVVPLFKKQIAAGGPVTVTHPEMKRFFMTITEASQLIIQAASMGVGGEIFVLDMGELVNITYLAEQMIKLAGYKPYDDIEISYTGLRAGEKLYEELFYANEPLTNTKHPKILKARYCPTNLSLLQEKLKLLEEICEAQNEFQLIQHLREIIPEYRGNLVNFEDPNTLRPVQKKDVVAI